MKTVTKTLSIAVLTAAFMCGPALVSTPSFDLGNANAAPSKEMAEKYKQEMFKQAHAFKTHQWVVLTARAFGISALRLIYYLFSCSEHLSRIVISMIDFF